VIGQMARLTISLPRELVSFTDEVANARKISRSRLISICVKEYAENLKVKMMKEGYMAMAKEHEEFAELASNVAHEAVPNWE